MNASTETTLKVARVLLDEYNGKVSEEFEALNPQCSCCDKWLPRMVIIGTDGKQYGRKCFANITGTKLPANTRSVWSAFLKRQLSKAMAWKFWDETYYLRIEVKAVRWPADTYEVNIIRSVAEPFAFRGKMISPKYTICVDASLDRDAALCVAELVSGKNGALVVVKELP